MNQMPNQTKVTGRSKHLRAALAEPAAVLVVVEDDHVLAALEDDVEVPAIDRLLGPPAVEHAPLLADHLDRQTVDETRRPVGSWLD